MINFTPARSVSDALGGGCLQRPMEASFLGALNRLHRTKAFRPFWPTAISPHSGESPLEGKVPNVARRMRWRRKNAYPRPAPSSVTALPCQLPPRGKPFRAAHIQGCLLLKQLIHTCAGTCAKLRGLPFGRLRSFSVLCGFPDGLWKNYSSTSPTIAM